MCVCVCVRVRVRVYVMYAGVRVCMYARTRVCMVSMCVPCIACHVFSVYNICMQCVHACVGLGVCLLFVCTYTCTSVCMYVMQCYVI